MGKLSTNLELLYSTFTQVFGDDPRVQDNSPGQRRETGVTLLAAQRAARRRNAGVRDSLSASPSESKEE
jgi:hypothetical protein